ncbi:tetraspanin tsp2 family [Moniliophthora roreri MCA 2997]|uniref:Tetraspanin tsp2 family n=1 Tax=Moniliophthora roreri (strain MCA 2997) TaxID=1381753 RepID=V2YE72_MONRO|nr:tetraspanin tsp2 family [Moniliophthora roreri MCA 2997]
MLALGPILPLLHILLKMQRVWSTYLGERGGWNKMGNATVSNSLQRQSLEASAELMFDESTDNEQLSPPRPERFQASTASSQSSIRSRRDTASISLSVNYLPSKFSDALLAPNSRRRRGKVAEPKRGGGTEAFRSGEARMPEEGDEDYDGVSSGWFGGSTAKARSGKPMKWNKFKWILFLMNTLLTIYSLTTFIFCLLTWFNVWEWADIIRVGNRPELVVSTIAASVGMLTSLVGHAGILLNNRSFLAVYTFLTWITFVFLVVPGYITYRRRSFNLEGKLNLQWSRQLGSDGRLRIQSHLGCCGYFSPFVEATVSQTCYARSVLPGCKLKYMNFERTALKRWYIVAFGLVPAQLGVMIAGLLCSNHVTYRFGKGMMPKAYRLSLSSMAVIMDNYANELAEQYGADAVARSRSAPNQQLSGQEQMEPMSYASNDTSGAAGGSHQKHDSTGQ